MEVIKQYVPKDDILEREPMKGHTTFRIGGEAACFVRISSEDQLRDLLYSWKWKQSACE